MSDSQWDARNLPPERPSSFDAKGKRVFLYPATVTGFYRQYRTYFYWFLIVIFLVLPWTQFAGEQTILLSLPERKFTFFGVTFWAHDAPLIFFPLIIATLGLTLVTAIWGRIWCGWACPQTVFLDALFRKVESWVEGDYIKRMKLDREPWTASKVFKKSLKWFLFFIISEHIAHSATAYFVGAHQLVWVTMGSPLDHWTLFLVVQFLAIVLLFDFGWFREQFCIIMCPYGRFQSVLMGRNSLAILYDEERGEPRKQKKKTENDGDCVNCFRCVNVCPTGIDIRDGVQMECIACTACADACDEIMTKLKKPTGLIRYASENELKGKERRIWTGRTFIYTTLIALLGMTFVALVYLRNPIDVKLLRGIGAPYTLVPSESGEKIVNHFRLHISNDSQRVQELAQIIPSDSKYTIVAPTLPYSIQPGEHAKVHFFTHSMKENHSGAEIMPVDLSWSGGETLRVELSILGPKSGSSTLPENP